MGHYSSDYAYSEKVAQSYKDATAAKIRKEVKAKRVLLLTKVSSFRKEVDQALIPDRFAHAVEDLENWLMIQTAE